MNKWLYDILRDSTLVDNQVYQADNGIFKNSRLQDFQLNKRGKGEWFNHKNNEQAIWSFLNKTSREIQKLFLTNKNKALVLFNEKEYEHNSEDNFIDVQGTDCRNFTLKTGNIIGYLQKGDYAIKISSRLGDNFLKFIISDAEGFLEIENYGGHDKDNGYEWLLIYLWKTKLRKAFRLGLPKKYITQRQHLTRLRGNLNPIHYFIVGEKNGTYDCEYREHSYNNEITKLIAATFKKVGHHEFLLDIPLIKNAFYTAADRNGLNRKELYKAAHFTNPFYKEYNDVIDLSKLILRDELSDFGEKSDSSAFFFDVSMLFEYFVRKLFKRAGYVLNNKFENRAEIPTGGYNYKRKLEPDIVFTHKGKQFIFDVKYKSFDFVYGANREDLFQLHTYIGQYGNEIDTKACGFIYPIPTARWDNSSYEKEEPFIHSKIKVLGSEIDFYILFIIVPNDNIKSYNAEFAKQNELFLKTIDLITN